jgi:hypothetical protein
MEFRKTREFESVIAAARWRRPLHRHQQRDHKPHAGRTRLRSSGRRRRHRSELHGDRISQFLAPCSISFAKELLAWAPGTELLRWIGEDQRVFRSAVEFGRKKRTPSDWSCQPGPLIASYFACIACMISMTCRKRTTQSRGVAIALTQGGTGGEGIE